MGKGKNDVGKMRRSLFHQEIKWELIGKNSVDNVTIQKVGLYRNITQKHWRGEFISIYRQGAAACKHVIDEDRKRNAEKIEDAFYSGRETKDKAEDENKGDVNVAKADPNQDTINALLKLMQNPEMAQALKQLAESANAK